MHCFVAVRELPVERLMAVAFWKTLVETDKTLTAEFKWSALPALGAEVTTFLKALTAHVAGQEPALATMTSAEWLPAGHPTAAILESVGYVATTSRSYHSADAAAWRAALRENLGSTVAPQIVSPVPSHFPALRSLLCGPSLRPSELAHGFHTAATTSPSLFDPRCSGVILTDGEPTAVCLAQHAHGHLTIAALFGMPSACHALLHHALQAHDHLPEPTTLSFHFDDGDSPASLATLLESLPHHPAAKLSRYTHTILPTSTKA